MLQTWLLYKSRLQGMDAWQTIFLGLQDGWYLLSHNFYILLMSFVKRLSQSESGSVSVIQ